MDGWMIEKSHLFEFNLIRFLQEDVLVSLIGCRLSVTPQPTLQMAIFRQKKKDLETA